MKNWKFTTTKVVCLLSLAAMLVSACGNSNSGSTSSSTSGSTSSTSSSNSSTTNAVTDTPVEPVKAKLVLSWLPQPENGGGPYAAVDQGFYEDENLDVTIQPGSYDVSPTQIVAAGNAEFGLGSADDLLVARENGIPLVAIATTFQTFPQALVYHSDSPIENFEELEGRSIYVYVGSAYMEYLKKTYNLKEIKEFKFNGYSEFAANPGSLAQAYATNQPYGLEKLGVSAGIKLIADSGYNPYNNIIFTTEDFLKEHPETVKAFLAATMKGWNYYFEHYEDINTILLEENPDVPIDELNNTAEQMKELVLGGDAQEHGVGYMSEARWSELAEQLLDLGIIQEKPDLASVYTVDYMPTK